MYRKKKNQDKMRFLLGFENNKLTYKCKEYGK